ncbi:MAG: hypothetical protein ACOCWF_03115, partial [Halochromatium sp.]
MLLALGMLVIQNAQAGPEIQRWWTPTGAKVLFVSAPELPMVDVRVVFDAGSARDGERPGLASLTAAMLSEGAGDLDADAIAERVEAVGAELGAGLPVPARHGRQVVVRWQEAVGHGAEAQVLDGEVVQHDDRGHAHREPQKTRVKDPGIADMDEDRLGPPVGAGLARKIARQGAAGAEHPHWRMALESPVPPRRVRPGREVGRFGEFGQDPGGVMSDVGLGRWQRGDPV